MRVVRHQLRRVLALCQLTHLLTLPPVLFSSLSVLRTLNLLVHSILDLLALSILDLLVQITFLVALLTLLPIYQTF